jgi:microcystin-dependent protein
LAAVPGTNITNQLLSNIILVIGKIFGGDGITTFCPSDLQGRTPTGMLHDTSNFGQPTGTENVTLNKKQMPAHVHNLDMHQKIRIETCTGLADTSITNPVNNSLATTTTVGENMYNSSPTSGVYLGDSYISPTTTSNGNGMSIPVRNPYAGINFSIVVQGEYPVRN